MRPSFCTAAKCYSIKSAPTQTGILELQNERGSFDGFIIGGEAGLGDRWRSKNASIMLIIRSNPPLSTLDGPEKKKSETWCDNKTYLCAVTTSALNVR